MKLNQFTYYTNYICHLNSQNSLGLRICCKSLLENSILFTVLGSLMESQNACLIRYSQSRFLNICLKCSMHLSSQLPSDLKLGEQTNKISSSFVNLFQLIHCEKEFFKSSFRSCSDMYNKDLLFFWMNLIASFITSSRIRSVEACFVKGLYCICC